LNVTGPGTTPRVTAIAFLQLVLEDRGWIIHRNWSTDWFRRPDELGKLAGNVEEVRVEWAEQVVGLAAGL
jgi:hypothetical protein